MEEKKRHAALTRETRETSIKLSIDLDGSGKSTISTGIGFLDHMLELFAKHGFFDLMIEEKGERIGLAESKKHLCRYTKGLRGACDVRGKLNLALSYEEIESLLSVLLENED